MYYYSLLQAVDWDLADQIVEADIRRELRHEVDHGDRVLYFDSHVR